MKLFFSLFIFSVTSFSFLFAQNVNIPDANFKAYLVGNSLINTNGDSEIQISEAENFSGEINCPGLNISDLTGIEAFTNLDFLNVSGNPITSINLSQNTTLRTLISVNQSLTSLNVSNCILLETLMCGNSPIVSLDLSALTALQFLKCDQCQLTSLILPQGSSVPLMVECQNNFLTSLDLSSTNLTHLWAFNNSLTSLDFSNNPNFEVIGIRNNQLSNLDVSQCSYLESLDCSFNQIECLNIKNNESLLSLYCTDNSNLTCIEVNNVAWASVNWTFSGENIGPQMSFSENCNNACSNTVGLSENLLDESVTIMKVFDMLGRETDFKTNTPLILMYSDGTVKRIVQTEE